MPTEQELDRIADDPEVAKRLIEARDLNELTALKGWERLQSIFERYQEAVATALAKRLLRGEDIEPKEIGFSMGYATAVTDLLHAPERVIEELERAAATAYQRLLEEEAESIDSPPYT